MRILCWFGFHKWGPTEKIAFFQEMFEGQFCVRCNCIREKIDMTIMGRSWK